VTGETGYRMEKIFATSSFDKELIYKELKKLNTKRIVQLINEEMN
jgi:hypothetical protein